MSKKKEVFKFSLQMLRENAWLIFVYFLIVALFGATFFLYNVPIEVYQDALLFTLPILLVVLSIRILATWNRHKKLTAIIEKEWFHVFEEEYASGTIIGEDYQLLTRKMAREVQKITDQKDSQEKELLDYYSMWSHQIKTPLAALDLIVQTLEDETKRPMKEEIFKIQQYLDMMLQYLRMQSIQNDFRFESFEVASLVKPVIRKYANFFIKKDLEVELLNLDQKIITDEKWFTFVLEQIIFNAIKYTKTGSITIYCPENTKELRIKDTGQGILPEDVPRVFDRGYTGFNGRENQKASGLGLFMSKEIAQQLGIKITLESSVGVGTEVCLSFDQK